jgi:hypothetical protein
MFVSFRRGNVAEKIVEVTLPQDKHLILGVVPGLCVADFDVSESVDSGAAGFAEYCSCVGVVFRLDGHAQDDVGLLDVGT